MDSYERIVDFGAGGGYIALELLHLCPNLKEISLYDYSDTALEKARANLAGVSPVTNFFKFDLNLPLPETENEYDLAIAFSVLEHLENIAQGVDNIFHALKPDGEALLVWSNTKSVFYLQHRAFERLGIWKYGLTTEMVYRQVANALGDRFSILETSVEPCFGDKGLLTVIDSLVHKVSPDFGRYVFFHLKKS